jgi:PKD repeat protein
MTPDHPESPFKDRYAASLRSHRMNQMRFALALPAFAFIASSCGEMPLDPGGGEPRSDVPQPILGEATGAKATNEFRIVTFGDSNTDVGYEGTKRSIRALSYVSRDKYALGPDDPHSPLQLAGKIEQRWQQLRGTPLKAVNHSVWGTTTGGDAFGGKDRSGGAPNARTVVDGVTRFEAEVLGVGAPTWHGGEPVSSNFPDGPRARVNAFVPGENSFAYISMGTNDVKRISTEQTTANLAWMIGRWASAGQDVDRFMITTLPPFDGAPEIPLLNEAIRALASQTGVHLIDLAAYTSDDGGLRWREPSLHVGDETHYAEIVRDWLAQQVVSHMDRVRPAERPAGAPSAAFEISSSAPFTEGDRLLFDASASSDPAGAALTYEWTFGDGSTGSGVTVAHSYVDDASYTAVLTVTNSSGLSDRDARIIEVANAAPVVDAGPDAAHPVGQEFALEASFTDAGIDDGRWIFSVDWGNGTSQTGNAKRQGAISGIRHIYEERGDYLIRITVQDKDGGIGWDEMTLTVQQDEAPVAMANGPFAADEGDWITMSSEGSAGGSGELFRYHWDFGDGTSSSGSSRAEVSKRYDDDGLYEVVLTVTNSFGVSAVTTTTAVIANVPPSARFSSPSAINEGSDYTIALTRGTDAGRIDRATLEYALNCGLGNGYSEWSQTVSSITCPLQLDQRPDITVSGKIRDKDGGESEYFATVRVRNVSPVVELVATSSTSITLGGAFSVVGSFRDDGVLDAPWTYVIEWGDGTTTTGTATDQHAPIEASHVFTKAGMYRPRLSVTDKDGDRGRSERLDVEVADSP